MPWPCPMTQPKCAPLACCHDVALPWPCPGPLPGTTENDGSYNRQQPPTNQQPPLQYKASIVVPDCPGPERVLTISSDLPTVLTVLNEVVPNLEENGQRLGNDEIDIRMLVHQSQAGCVIGKGGNNIKILREKTGARIKIYSNCCPRSTDRLISICGKPTTCIECIRELIATIKTSPLKGVNNPYDPHNFDDYYADEYGGYGGSDGTPKTGPYSNISPAGFMFTEERGDVPASSTVFPRRENRMNRFPHSSRGGHRGGSGGGGMSRGGPMDRRYGGGNSRSDGGGGSGNSGGYEGGRNSGYSGGNRSNVGPSAYNAGDMWGDMQCGGGGGGGGSGSGGGAPNGLGGSGNSGMSGPSSMGGNNPPVSQSNAPLGSKTSTQVTIPKDLAGAIIGKGGQRIRKIRADSGACITIDEPLRGSNDRIITIVGLPSQIQMAQYLLQQSVHENADLF